MGDKINDAHALLAALEPAARLRPRDRLSLGLGNGEGTGVEILYAAAIESLKGGDEPVGIRCLLALAELCREVECSELLGVIGGHTSILRLISDGEVFASNDGRKRERASLALGLSVDSDNNSVGDSIDTNSFCEEDGEEENEVQAAAATVAARVASSGCSFPMRSTAPCSREEGSECGRHPLRYDFVVCGGCTLSMSNHIEGRDCCPVVGEITPSQGTSEPTCSNGNISILVRPVKERQHSQFDVGFQMWPAAVILSRWMCANPEVIRGRCVLEVGSGLGLCGLVAAHLADTVTLSDFNPVVLRALEANVALNAGCTTAMIGVPASARREEGGVSVSGAGELRRVAIDTPGQVRVRHLDWDLLQAPEDAKSACQDPHGTPVLSEGSSSVLRLEECDLTDVVAGELGSGDFERVRCDARFDVIIASDHICQTSDAHGSIRVLRTLLARGGQAHFVVAHPRTRFGVDALVPLLENCSEFDFTCEEVSDPDLVSGLEEAAYLAWLHVHVWWRNGETETDLVSDGDGGFETESKAALLVVG